MIKLVWLEKGREEGREGGRKEGRREMSVYPHQLGTKHSYMTIGSVCFDFLTSIPISET